MKRGSKAFTLIELMIATALISAVFASLFFFFYSSIGVMNKASDVSGSLRVVRFVSARLTDDIRQSGGAAAGSSSSRLLIGNIKYEFIDGKLKRTENTDVYNMTDDGELKAVEFHYEGADIIKIAISPRSGGSYLFAVHARN